ncbi:Polynucleotidyl transferase ribonuclease H-like superfamily protein [Euphorbia peplus]|nr:Polynucleotidyl transferase ribonuclease H-like superfamily protein [Euphorbia peplus]
MLWVRVLRHVYARACNGLSIFRAHPPHSHIWGCILKGAAGVHIGAARVVGNGESTKFWTDIWVGTRPLLDQRISDVPEEKLGDRVLDYWRADGGWSWPAVEGLLSLSCILQMASVLLLSDPEAHEFWHWRLSSSGNFFVTSIYHHYQVRKGYRLEVSAVWESFWDLVVPERVKYFLWLVVDDKILTNVNRVRRHLSQSNSCENCFLPESSLHVIRDCHRAREVWDRLVPTDLQHGFYSLDLPHWIQINLKSKACRQGFKWNIIFATVAWWLWKWRCCRVFHKEEDIPVNRLIFLEQQVRGFKEAVRGSRMIELRGRHDILISWIPPRDDWMMINYDGACKGNPGYASAGGLARGSDGAWLGGYGINLGVCNSVLAEIWGLYLGLEIARKKGFDKVIIAMDSQIVVRMINDDTFSQHCFAWLLRKCQELIRGVWEVRIVHVYREGNRAADWLANFAGLLSLGHHEFDVPPAGIQDILVADCSGVSFTRNIRD